MTPRENAIELYDKFCQFAPAEEAFEDEYTKASASICVDEEIRLLKDVYMKIYSRTIDFSATSVFSSEIKFLEEVKTEIQKL